MDLKELKKLGGKAKYRGINHDQQSICNIIWHGSVIWTARNMRIQRRIKSTCWSTLACFM